MFAFLSLGSVSSNDSGHGSSYAQHETTGSSVYTAADCRLLQQISNTATRNLNSQCSNRALSPHPMSLIMNAASVAPPLPPPSASSITVAGSSGSIGSSNAAGHQMSLIQTLSPPPPPPPYKPRTTQSGVPMYHVPINPLPPPQIVSSGAAVTTPLMPPPSRYTAAATVMLHQPNHRHTSNMHGKLDAGGNNYYYFYNNNNYSDNDIKKSIYRL